MTRSEVARVQSYLRKTFGNNGIEIDMPEKWLEKRLETLTKSQTLHISQAN